MAKACRVVLVLGAFLLASIALAVDKQTDFSGTWVLEKAERSFSPMMGGGGSSLPGSDTPPGGGGVGLPGSGGMGGGYPGGGGGSRRGGAGYPGGGRRAGGTPDSPGEEESQALTLTITQTETELKMDRKRNLGTGQLPVTQTFTLDGKENSNPDERGRGEYKSKTKWHKESLVIDGTQQGSGGGRSLETRIKQELSLSKDGQVLTIKTSRITPQGTMTLKQTFKKQ
jgi:hypothetical protein